MNSTVKIYLRVYSCYDQYDWNQLLLLAELVLNIYITATTETSLFFLSYSFYLTSFVLIEDLNTLVDESVKSPIQKGEAIIWKITKALSQA